MTVHLTRLKETLNELCLGKISRHKTVRIKFSMDSGFLNMLVKNEKPETPEINRKPST